MNTLFHVVTRPLQHAVPTVRYSRNTEEELSEPRCRRYDTQHLRASVDHCHIPIQLLIIQASVWSCKG